MPNDVNEKRKTIAEADASAAGEQRHGDLAESRSGRRAERRGRLVDPWVEARPERAHDPNDDRDVEEGVRDQDRRPAAVDRRGEDREEGKRHDDRREHERDDDERADEPATAEAVAAEDVRGWERDCDGEERRGERLPRREPHDVACRRVGEDVERRVARSPQTTVDDRPERVGEEEREESERDPVGQRRA